MILVALLLPLLASAAPQTECQTAYLGSIREGYSLFREWHAKQKRLHAEITKRSQQILVRHKAEIIKSLREDRAPYHALMNKYFRPIEGRLNKISGSPDDFYFENDSKDGTLSVHYYGHSPAPEFPSNFIKGNDVSVFLKYFGGPADTEVFATVMYGPGAPGFPYPSDRLEEHWITSGFSETMPKQLSDEQLIRIANEFFNYRLFFTAYPECMK